MKTFQTAGSRKLSIGLISLMVLAFSQNAYAAGTLSGTSITNSATVDYQVGGQDQTQESSTPISFVVDNKVDLTVTTSESATVSAPLASTKTLTFTVKNTGNTVQDFMLTPTDWAGGTGPFGGTDNVNITTVNAYVEDGTTGGYQSGEDTATYIDELAAEGTVTVYIVSTVQAGLSNGDIAVYELLVEARVGGTGGGGVGGPLAEDTGGDISTDVQIVFGDGDGDLSGSIDSPENGKHSDAAQYTIAAATLSVSKSSAVISDPFNDTTFPLAIPGAVIEYTITISNAASTATATSIVVSDSINAEIAKMTFDTGTIKVTAPNINGGAEKTLTDISDADEGDWNVTGTNTVTVTGITLNAGESATVKFRVTIQ